MSVISEQFNIIQQRLQDLHHILVRVQPMAALAYPIPPVPKGQEDNPVSFIPAIEHTGRNAASLASQCYRDLHIDPQYSQKSARRTVGVLWLSPVQDTAVRHIPALVHEINDAKTAIEEHIISTFSSRHDRFDALRAECPGIMTLHLYRHIRCYTDENVLSARFSWQQKDSLSTPDKKALMHQLNHRLEQGRPEQHLPLTQLLDRIEHTPEALLRIRRPVRVQPVANMRWADAPAKTVTAPMPLLVVQRQSVDMKPLAEFKGERHRKVRTDKVKAQTLGTFEGVTIEAFPERN